MNIYIYLIFIHLLNGVGVYVLSSQLIYHNILVSCPNQLHLIINPNRNHTQAAN